MRVRKQPPGVDPKHLIKDAAKLLPQSSRRRFLRGATSLGALTFRPLRYHYRGVRDWSGHIPFARDLVAALSGQLSHEDLSVYNAVQRLLYLGVILAGIVAVLSGLSIWKPVQVQELTALFGGYDAARYVHFFAMTAIVGFLVIHILLALIVPKSLRAMVIGR